MCVSSLSLWRLGCKSVGAKRSLVLSAHVANNKLLSACSFLSSLFWLCQSLLFLPVYGAHVCNWTVCWQEGCIVEVLSGHTSLVQSIDFSADREFIVSLEQSII